jgi:RING finger family protein
VRGYGLFFKAEFWIATAIALALFFLVYLAIRAVLARHDRRQARFSRNRLRLLGAAALELGADTVDDPRVAGVPYLKSRPPDPPYGLALAPAGEEEDDYFPIFEAPVTAALFVEAWPSGSPYPPLRVSMGGGGVSIGDPEFEAAYIVRTDDPHFARSVLGPEARALIEQGRRIGRGGSLRLNLDRLRLRVRKEEALTSAPDLVSFVRVGLGLLEQVREAVESREAVQYFDATPAADLKPNCPVCAASVVDRRVTCRRCRTPHHRECWEYARGCSMFACGESRFSL